MKNIWLITKREYFTQVRKKSFVILTILAPLMVLALGAFMAYLMNSGRVQHTVNVIDKSEIFRGQLKSDDDIKYIFVNPESENQLKSTLKEMPEIDGLLIIPPTKDFSQIEQGTEFLVNKKIGLETRAKISADLGSVLRTKKIQDLGLSKNEMENLEKPFPLKINNVAENSENSDLELGVQTGLSFLLMYSTLMFIIIYGVRVMRSVLEEKNNRVVEILISSVKPFELMMGKILGVTGVALTQFLVWITMAVLGALFLNKGFGALQTEMMNADEAANLDFTATATEISHTLLSLNYPQIIVVFILFFLLGYIFYSSMYAAIGSAVDNETETQQFTLFAVVPLMIAMYGSFSIINNPESPMALWLSIIPFTSPVAMVARIPFGVPLWQILLSLSLLIISALLMVWIAGKIYRVGILMYGNKATFRELWKWIKG